MSAKSQRLGRIEGEMQRVLSTLVSREVRDPRVGNVTITDGQRRAGHVHRAHLLRAVRRASTRPKK